MDRFKLLTLLALRSMVSHRVKNFIVGTIMVVGTLLVVVGTSMLDSVRSSMQEGITSSATGHIQVFSSDAKDDLAIFGNMGAATMDIGELNDYERIERELRKIPHVVDVVPMALGNAVSFGKSELDRVLLELRERSDGGETTATERAQISRIAALMLEQNRNAREISTDLERWDEEKVIIDRVLAEDFWSGFDEEPGQRLEFLDTQFAPLSTEGKLLYFRYIATDPSQFARDFSRFQIVDGQAIPEGHRGILLSKRFYEKQVKSRLARELDSIVEEHRDGQRIAQSEVLASQVRRAARMTATILYQLDPDELKRLDSALGKIAPEAEGEMEARIAAFLSFEDGNIEERYKFFYDTIAPMIDVYDVAVGEEIVLQSFTKSGYARSAKVKVWGTFNFRGLEGSDLAGAINLMDLATFRTLYGKMTEEQRLELDDIRKQAGVTELTREDAEDALFGGEDELVEAADLPAQPGSTPPADDNIELEMDKGAVERLQKVTYEPGTLRDGVLLNAAVILDDANAVEEVMGAIERVSRDRNLNIRALTWQQSSGIVGQFILVISLVLYTAIITIFTVALVIINNSMVMATMERIPEIGTIRAIGGQKSTIMLLTLLETAALCFVAGTIGALAGAGLVSLMGSVGIPANNDVMVFLFGGPRLYPEFGASNLITGFVIILVVSVLSTIYPAMVANRVQPAVAMRAKE